MRAIAIFACALAVPAAASAHPHIWISYRVSFVFGSAGLDGFYERWTFDKNDSDQILQSFDTSHTGILDGTEVESIRTGYFENTRDYHYFVTARIDGTEVLTVTARDFDAFVDGELVVYQFYVPCAVPAGAAPHTVTVVDWDPSYFVDFTADARPVAFVAPQSVTVEDSVRNDLEDHYLFPPDLYISQAPPDYLRMVAVRFWAKG